MKTKEKKRSKILISGIMAVLLLLGTVPMCVSAQVNIEYYGRTALAKLSNADELLYAYDEIVKGVEASSEIIPLSADVYRLTEEELKTVIDAYRRDHTEHFWFGNRYGYSLNTVDKTIVSLQPIYIMSGDALATAKAEFNNAVNEMLKGINFSMSEYEREKVLHDRLVAKVSYDDEAASSGNQVATIAHSSYGALVEGKAVCEGYAEAFQYLLQRAGLQGFIITGKGNGAGHEWNVVRVDGKFYHVDSTWDDQGNTVCYAYLNKTDARIAEDHIIDETAYALPICDSETADYFTVNGGKLETFDIDEIAALMKCGGGTARIYVTGDMTTFEAEWNENIFALLQRLGAIGCSRLPLGREWILTIQSTTAGVMVSGTVTSFGNEMDKVNIQLLKSGSSDVAYQLAVDSGEDYTIANVLPGTYTMRVSKVNHVIRDYIITVAAENVTQNIEIYLNGDMDRDSSVNAKDMVLLKKHLIGTDPLSSKQLEAADGNSDNIIDLLDLIRLKKLLAGV